MTKRRYAIVALLLGTGQACSGAVQPEATHLLRVEIARQTYAAGDTVDVILTNIGSVRLGYGLCSVQVERRAAHRWLGRSLLPDGVGCPDIGYVLDPGESALHLICCRRM